ncbi:hypothetical protein [Mycobacterium sp. M23085]|uniref:hypothetical protein n=1 Tax=Mycobacterium sp. M23085 TaxID=3378087 RepID=UPI003877CE75
MANGQAGGRWGRILRYTFGAALCVVTVVAARAGVHWYLCLFGFCLALMLILGRRRIFRAGVNRSADEIVCRYVPWYEGNVYVLNVLVPVLGMASVGAGWAPGNPLWLRFTGIILLAATPLFVFSAVRMWRRCLLRITPSALTVRLAAPRDELTEIRRDCVLSIEPKIVPNSVSGQSLQVGIAYRTADLSSDTRTVLLGLQLSVEPVNLLKALVAWKDGASDNPSALLDRIDGILRGRSRAGV